MKSIKRGMTRCSTIAHRKKDMRKSQNKSPLPEDEMPAQAAKSSYVPSAYSEINSQSNFVSIASYFKGVYRRIF
jgi:hypothetical protein